jgi:hypothetical protein
MIACADDVCAVRVFVAKVLKRVTFGTFHRYDLPFIAFVAEISCPHNIAARHIA